MQHLGEEKQGSTGDIFLKSTSIGKLTLYNVIGKKNPFIVFQHNKHYICPEKQLNIYLLLGFLKMKFKIEVVSISLSLHWKHKRLILQ